MTSPADYVRILPTSDKYIPFVSTLGGENLKYWAEDFQEWRKAKPQLEDLESERVRIANLPMSESSFMLKVREWYEEAEKVKIQHLAEHLESYRQGGRNPFLTDQLLGPLGRLGPAHSLPYDWQQITQAFQFLAPGITDKEREKQLLKLDERISKLRAIVEGLQPAHRFLLHQGKIVLDSWKVFFEHWATLQKSINAPCGYQALALDETSQTIQWAYGVFELKSLVNPKGRHPARQPRAAA